MTNGDLIRLVFPLLDDATIGHIATSCLPCVKCPINGDRERCGDQEHCSTSIYNYMKEEAKLDGRP